MTWLLLVVILSVKTIRILNVIEDFRDAIEQSKQLHRRPIRFERLTTPRFRYPAQWPSKKRQKVNWQKEGF